MTSYLAAILIPNKQHKDKSMNFIGGAPTFGNEPWPVNPLKPDEPLHLLAQLNCEEIHRAVPSNPLPTHGVLQFFLDTENFVNTEDRPSSQVVWQSEVNLDEMLPPPERLQSIGGQMWSYLVRAATAKMEAPVQLEQTPLEIHPIETTAEKVMLDVGKLKGLHWDNYNKQRIGEWYFWHQSLGQLPKDAGGGPSSRFPETKGCTLLLRLVCDAAIGLDWDGHHNPSLTYWISNGDLESGQWDRAFVLFTDF